MKPRFFSILCVAICLLFICVACIDPKPAAIPSPEPEVSSSPKPEWSFGSAEEIVLALTSPEAEGRLVGSRGGKRVEEYIAGAFEAAGLAPFSGSSFFIEYTEQIAEPSDVNPEVTAVAPDGTKTTFTPGVDYTFTLPLLAHDVQLPLNGKKAECESGEAILYTVSYSTALEYVSEQPGRIAIADMVGKSVSSDNHVVLKRPSGVLISVLSEPMRNILRAEGTQLCIRMQAAVQEEGTARNIAGYFPGENGKEALLVLAHFDGSGSCGELLFPSAYDNASGVAVLLCSLASFAEKDISPARDVIFLASNGEESGKDGARTFASLVEARYERMNTINLDCIGHAGRDFIDIYTEDTVADTNPLAAALEELGTGLNVQVRNEGYSGDGMLFMNHANRLAITLSDAAYDDTDLCHMPEDTADTLDYARMERISALVADYLCAAHSNPLYEYQPSEAEASAMDDKAARREAVIAEFGLAADTFVCLPPEGGPGFAQLYFGQKLLTPEALEAFFPGLSLPREAGGFALARMEVLSEWMNGTCTVSPAVSEGAEQIPVRQTELMLDARKVYPVSLLLEHGALQIAFNVCYESDTESFMLRVLGYTPTEFSALSDAENAALILGDEAFSGIRLHSSEAGIHGASYSVSSGSVLLSLSDDIAPEAAAELLRALNLPSLLTSIMN